MGDRDKDPSETGENPEQEARIWEFTRRFTEAVLGLVQERITGHLKSAMLEAGFSLSYIYKLMNGERTMSLGLAGKLLEVTGVSLEELARRLLQQEASQAVGEPALTERPATLLAAVRGDSREEESGSPFLRKLSEFLAQIAQRKLIEGRRPPAWRAILLVLEEERMRDWQKTRQRLERFGLGLARKLARQAEISRTELVDLATLIAAWASVQRVAGFGLESIDALEAAFALADRSGDVWAQGFCLQKAAYLTQAFGHDDLALALINRAALCYSEAGTADDLARILIDRGYFTYCCGQRDEALRMLEAGLRKVDPNQRLYIVSAHLALARIYRENDDRSRARSELRSAIECQMPGSVEAAFVSWEAAKQEIEFQDFAAAEILLQDSLQIFSRQGRGGDLAFVALDYAEILWRTQRPNELKQLLADVLGWLGPMPRANRAFAKTFENLAALLALGNLGEAELEAARQQCRRTLARRAV